MRIAASMALVSTLTSVGVGFAGTIAVAACSGANPNVFPTPDVVEAAPPPSEINGDSGTFDFDGALITEAAPAICDPQSVAGFKPTWTPPEAWKQNVCTPSQISAFYAACLTPPISETTCKAWVGQYATCSACLQTEDTAPTAGAIVWHEHDAYWTVNVAGCIAQATGDTSGTGCGGSYAAAIACRQASCNACWQGQGQTTTFQEFATCEEQAGGTTCSSFAQAVPATCGDLTTSPASVCMPSSGATAQDAFMQVAPLFCGM